MKALFTSNENACAQRKIITLFAIVLISYVTACKKETITSNSADVISQTVENVVTVTPHFGALISGSDVNEKIQVCNLLGVDYVRDAVMLKDFTGTSNTIDAYKKNGYKVLLNLNYDNVLNANGKKWPVPFPTNMTEYRNLLNKVFDKYQPEIAVIENEPTTNQYHSGPIENYITELKTAVDVCKKRGIKVADGGLHVQYVQLVMSGYGSGRDYEETKKLIAAYKTIDLTYINVHTPAPFNSSDNSDVYPPGVLEKVANYLRAQTGKPVICNEYDQKNQSTLLMISAVNAFIAGGYKYVVARSDGSDGQGEALNNGTKLTDIGRAYRDAIK